MEGILASEADKREDRLFERVVEILDAARTSVVRTVNTAMVSAYWSIGREIVEVEQGGSARAGYGDELVQRLSRRLTKQYGKGFNSTGIKRMRQFYLTFPSGSRFAATSTSANGAALRHLSSTHVPTFPPQLSWTHYRKLLSVEHEGGDLDHPGCHLPPEAGSDVA